MYKKLISVGLIISTCAIVLTTCKQESTIKRLQNNLLQANIQAMQLFGYNPDLELVSTKSPEGDLITITAHGYGSNKKTGNNVAKYAPLTGYVLTLNLPDHDQMGTKNYQFKYGTISELLPYLYAIKLAVDAGIKKINLYGFSAGGGVVINSLAVLNGHLFDAELEKIGITNRDKKEILNAIEKGVVLLDAPLKTIEEVIAGRGSNPELEMVAKQYKENNLRPIDSLEALHGLKLNIVLYFENPDEIIFNRDDAEFIKRLKEANSLGSTRVIEMHDGGHINWHSGLWQEYVHLH